VARIPFNPYIVGNPIRSREMFFGREDDFQYVMRKIGSSRSNQVLVFCGERRSGKTSILFQILGGRLGERFLPVLVDMQILAGIRDDAQFWKAILKTAVDTLQVPELGLEELARGRPESRLEELFEGFLSGVESRFPERTLLFLLDEYELIEEKIRDGSLSESTIHYLAGALESPHRISFIFTGSTNLENRKVSFWKGLLAKSIYRKISYLSHDDTARLVREPLAGSVSYPNEVVERIYRLSGGHPFYTQVICQNLVDRLIEEDRAEPTAEDLAMIVTGIVDNPLPQMIYSWNSLSDSSKILLAALGGSLADGEAWAEPGELARFLRSSRLRLAYARAQLLISLEEAYHRELLEKREGERYRFRMDLLRLWVRREHSIWKVVKEARPGYGAGAAAPKAPRWLWPAAAALVVLGLAAAGWRFLPPLLRPGPSAATASEAEGQTPSPVPAGEEPAVRRPAPEAPAPGSAAKPAITTAPAQPRESSAAPPAEAPLPEAPDEQPLAEGPALGALFLTSTPLGARILLDGEDTGLNTPNLFEKLPAGSHRLGLLLEGHRQAEVEVEVPAGDTLKWEAALEPSYGEILFDVRPTARILLDGVLLVETPYVKPVRVPSGRHALTILNDSLGVRREREIVVAEGQTLTIAEVLPGGS